MVAPGEGDAGVLLYAYRGCIFRVPDGVQPPKAGSRFFARHLAVTSGERLLEIGAGLGLAAVLAAKAGAHVVATDVVPIAVETVRGNAILNGVTVDARLGDCYDPVPGERFDVVCTNAPQMPTPPAALRGDPVAAADNGGPDGWAILDEVITGAPDHLTAGGRLVFTIFDFLGVRAALAKLDKQGLIGTIIGREVQPFPRLGYERLDYLRTLDTEGTLPRVGMPATVERLAIQGVLPR
jgi:release factor glutamine methyltransferase